MKDSMEKDLKIACDALKEIQTLPSVRDDESSGIAYRARKSIEWGHTEPDNLLLN